MFRAWLSGTTLALLLLAAAGPARAACELTRYASADLLVGPNGALLVPVNIAGRDAWMVLQMASGLAMISPAAVRQLGLPTGWVRTDVRMNFNGQPIEREAKIDHLIIGGANFTGWTMYVEPGPERPVPTLAGGRPISGTLSARYMNAVDMELDVGNGRINLFKQARCRGGQIYWNEQFTTETLYTDPSGLLFFPVEVDGRRVETALNTLGPRSRLSERIAQRYFDFERNDAAARAPGGNATGRIIGQRRISLTARELSLPDLPVHVYADGARRCEVLRERKSGAIGFNNCAGFAPFEIGTDVLRQLRIYVASGEQRIYITRNGKSGSPAANGADRAAAADP